MQEFKTYHPIVNFTYFVFSIIFSCIFMHPICLIISLFCGILLNIIIGNKGLLKLLPLFLLSAVINPLFNHEGVTILTYFPNGNPLTMESIVYGIAAAIMLSSVIMHFSCFNKIITSDKFTYLFGKLIPSLSLIFSMVLRFIPKFRKRFKQVSAGQRCLGYDVSDKNLTNRAKYGLKILSIMITWSLENAVETADSMKSRGWGLPGRTAYSNFTFDARDKKAFFTILFFGIYVLFGAIYGKIDYTYFPAITDSEISIYSLSVFSAYFILLLIPIIIELWEDRKWKSLQRKI